MARISQDLPGLTVGADCESLQMRADDRSAPTRMECRGTIWCIREFSDTFSLPVHSIDIIDHIKNVPARRPAPTNTPIRNRTLILGVATTTCLGECVAILNASKTGRRFMEHHTVSCTPLRHYRPKPEEHRRALRAHQPVVPIRIVPEANLLQTPRI